MDQCCHAQLGQGPHLAGLDSGKPWVTGRPEGVRRGSRQANIPTGPAGLCVPSTHRAAPSAALLPSPALQCCCVLIVGWVYNLLGTKLVPVGLLSTLCPG